MCCSIESSCRCVQASSEEEEEEEEETGEESTQQSRGKILFPENNLFIFLFPVFEMYSLVNPNKQNTSNDTARVKHCEHSGFVDEVAIKICYT